MDSFEPKPLHLHSLDSLIADLVSGRPVITAGEREFTLDERARSALQWYREKGPNGWTANVSAALGENLVDKILQEPPQVAALPSRPANANSRRLTLKKVEAHRFAGLHKFGIPAVAPENYVHEFFAPVTLFEGRNGSGKTSLANAIIWALTGEILRPQREPEKANDEFECWAPGENGDDTSHRLSPVTPMPNIGHYRPDQAWIPTDTWVELTFVDERGTTLAPIRRSHSRSAQGKLTESEPNLSVLGIDPMAVRIGTVMPGLLPLIKVGSESELGRAVSQLTGLSALVDLAEHVRRAKNKIGGDFVKAKIAERERADSAYNTAKFDLKKELEAHPSIAPAAAIPVPSDAVGIEQELDEITAHFESAKAGAFESARTILGSGFDPADLSLRGELEKNIVPALEHVRHPQNLPSTARLSALRSLTSEQLDAAELEIANILAEAQVLEALARDPSTAARSRLYARIASWIADHPDSHREKDLCVVCGGSLKDALDPVSGRSVVEHLHDAMDQAALLSQTLGHWSENAVGHLMRSLPEPLQRELSTDLPAHPCDLLRKAIVDELFAFAPFGGVLSGLKSETANAFERVTAERSDLEEAKPIALPAQCAVLSHAVKRLDLALRFSKWRHSNDPLVRDVVTRVLGRSPKEGEPVEVQTLTGKLLDLDKTVRDAKPISDALVQCERLKAQLKLRRSAERRLREYEVAKAALEKLSTLGALADQQVDVLRKVLRTDAAAWRNRIYLGAFPDTAHELVDTGMGRKGEIELVVRVGGISAPAQHVTNASALRASLVAFYLAFWEHVLNERGGLNTLLLDDPQELLDDENRERLAASLNHLAKAGAQLIVTSYDPRFSGCVSRLPTGSGVEHLEVLPATQQQPVVRTIPPLTVILERKARFEANNNLEEPARDFADGCRVFLEAKLGDMFDDPAHSSWAKENPNPTLADFVGRLRPLVKAGPQGMFSAHVFRRFVEHPALTDNSPTLTLMNKSHHGRRHEIRAADVVQCAEHLSALLELVEQMHEECYRWRRRDVDGEQLRIETLPALTPMASPMPGVVICPDLAAFTQQLPEGQSQEAAQPLDPHLLDGKVVFFLRRNTFGLAAPAGALAIVEAIPSPAADRRLVIARYSKNVYARRFLRGANSGVIGLTAEVLDPRTRTPKTVFLPEAHVLIHQVVGIVFDHDVSVGPGPEEAVQVEANSTFANVEIAFRVIEDSAAPLALENQIVLGGKCIELDALAKHQDSLVALTLDDGSSIFKRVGASLPGALSHLRQFESIGGLGSSQVLAVGKQERGFRNIQNARLIIGVLYHG